MQSITIFLNPQHDLYHSGYLLSAAISAGAGIRLESSVHPLIPRLDVGDRRFSIDLLDSPGSYDAQSLRQSDVYFKRSYLRADLPIRFSAKIVPFGLNYSCRTNLSLLKVLTQFGLRMRRAAGWKNYLLSPTPETFEVAPEKSYDPQILFQTRLWAAEEMGPTESAEDINGFRVKMVVELKRAFGKRYKGGLVPSPAANFYPHLLTTIQTHRRKYAKTFQGTAIGIYTRGLHGSNAFKVAEYLAGSKCIVGQSLAHQIPIPLGECHSVQESVDETVAECDALLSAPSRMEDIRRASWRYYQSYLRYDRRLAHLLHG